MFQSLHAFSMFIPIVFSIYTGWYEIFIKFFPNHFLWMSRSVNKILLFTRKSYPNVLSVLPSQNTECMRGPKAFRGQLVSLLLTFFLFCLRRYKSSESGEHWILHWQMQSRCVTLPWNVWISSTYGLCQMWSCILLSAMVCAGKSALFASDVSLFPPLHLHFVVVGGAALQWQISALEVSKAGFFIWQMQINCALHWGSELKCFESFNLCQWHSLFQGILIHHRILLSACFFTYAVFMVWLFQRSLKLFSLLCLLFVLFEDLLHGYKSWHWMSRKLGSPFWRMPNQM